MTSEQPPEYIQPEIFKSYPQLLALQSTRKGGVSKGGCASLNLGNNTGDAPENIRENTRRLCAALGIDPRNIASSVQIHGTKILKAEEPGQYEGYDGFMTNKKDLFLAILTADCYPVLFYDPHHQAVGAAHAGWKGSAHRIVIKTLEAMHTSFNSNPAECLVSIGTGISAAAYEVDREIAGAFPSGCVQRSPRTLDEERYLLDLAMVNYLQLLEAGVNPSHIERSPFCSFGDHELFFSYRRDQGKTGRMISLIGIRSEQQSA